MAKAKSKTPVPKRQYSRAGCQECKRRKLKCDEQKPACWQCSHLGKTCVYLKKIKFSETRNVTIPVERHEHPRVHYDVIEFGKDDEGEQGSATPEVTGPRTHISPMEDRQRIINEASTLANTLISSLDVGFDDFVADLTLIPEFMKKKDVLDSFGLQDPHKTRLEVFYDKISAWLFPFQQQLCTEIILSHARTSPYLLAAMLSLATSDGSKGRYISTCLKSLNAVFQDHSQILSNIEPLILTVLVLAADSTSSDWRAHLRGAKDLFTKYIRFYTTPALILAKSWFAAIEILAGLQYVGTGKAHELDELLDVGLYGDNSEVAVSMGLLLPNGYNLFLGYSTEALIMYREFIKLGRGQVTSEEVIFQMSLIHSAKEFQVASETILIERTMPTHPEYDGEEEKVILPWSCYGFQGDQVYSWFDLAHQIHVDALLLKVYGDWLSLPIQHPLTQELVKKMLSICFFFIDGTSISDPEDSRLLMLQGPMLACGAKCIDPEDKNKVRAYFDAMIQYGVRSAKASFKKVQRAWDGTRESDNLELVPFA